MSPGAYKETSQLLQQLADFYFRNAPPAEALAALAQLKATVLADEAAALLAQSTRSACGGNIIYDSAHPQECSPSSLG